MDVKVTCNGQARTIPAELLLLACVNNVLAGLADGGELELELERLGDPEASYVEPATVPDGYGPDDAAIVGALTLDGLPINNLQALRWTFREWLADACYGPNRTAMCWSGQPAI